MDGFYEDNPVSAWRFGDVVRGFHVVTPQIDDPEGGHLQILVTMPPYLAVLTPCCSIEDKAILVAPLQQIRRSLWDNPFFAEDLTRINRKVPAEHCVPPKAWQSFSPEQKQERLEKGAATVSADCFIYNRHDLLPTYTLLSHPARPEVGHYMVDFKTMFRLQCGKITRQGQSNNTMPGMKILQLTIETRAILRDRLLYYFGRIPDEDAILA